MRENRTSGSTRGSNGAGEAARCSLLYCEIQNGPFEVCVTGFGFARSHEATKGRRDGSGRGFVHHRPTLTRMGIRTKRGRVCDLRAALCDTGLFPGQFEGMDGEKMTPDEIKRAARSMGFDDCRIAPAGEAAHAKAYAMWLADGCHGDMAWMERDPRQRSDPRLVLDDCRSVICLAMNYYPGEVPTAEEAAGPGYRVARYAWNEDYHDIIWEKLREFDAMLRQAGGSQRTFTDTGPVLERDFASASGLGWNGKSTVQIHPKLGTWFFLAEILTTLDLEPDQPMADHCGKCDRCIRACPTAAITAPHRLDARKCISYLTIEHKGPIPLEFREAIGDRIYGCDDCLSACPWNRHAQVSHELRFHARQGLFRHSLRDFLALDDAAFRSLFDKSPIKRIKRARFLRNVCVALGNTGTAEDMPALEQAAHDPDPLIAEHAAWALTRIRCRTEGA